jgi:hypothetical protein
MSKKEMSTKTTQIEANTSYGGDTFTDSITVLKKTKKLKRNASA